VSHRSCSGLPDFFAAQIKAFGRQRRPDEQLAPFGHDIKRKRLPDGVYLYSSRFKTIIPFLSVKFCIVWNMSEQEADGLRTTQNLR